VRELHNVLSVAVAMAQGGMLHPRHLDLPDRLAAPEIGYHERVLNYRRRLVEEALSGSGGNRAEAARRLGVTRQALSYLVRKLEISL
jgi:DNA-binding NtrC family response regulator